MKRSSVAARRGQRGGWKRRVSCHVCWHEDVQRVPDGSGFNESLDYTDAWQITNLLLENCLLSRNCGWTIIIVISWIFQISTPFNPILIRIFDCDNNTYSVCNCIVCIYVVSLYAKRRCKKPNSILTESEPNLVQTSPRTLSPLYVGLWKINRMFLNVSLFTISFVKLSPVK